MHILPCISYPTLEKCWMRTANRCCRIFLDSWAISYLKSFFWEEITWRLNFWLLIVLVGSIVVYWRTCNFQRGMFNDYILHMLTCRRRLSWCEICVVCITCRIRGPHGRCCSWSCSTSRRRAGETLESRKKGEKKCRAAGRNAEHPSAAIGVRPDAGWRRVAELRKAYLFGWTYAYWINN